ncbi:GIY-YIG nuclease family protein [Kushneria sp. TE3]|uniref:GIY-YIG nuclease family protein n=1 Tax=Kushneria sp. TE3 TaxID=3449832 RepID=UPI003F683654
MTQGRSIRLFLVDGTPNGLLTAEIMNWTGHVLTGPRTKLSELVLRPECGRTGIYFLVGPDPDNSLRPLVYIGESDDVGNRLKQHNRPEVVGPGGGKDFWERVCLITSKDQNLTKAHVKYLESLLIKNAGDVGRAKLINGTAHEYINLPESDRADMAFFAEQIRTVMPVLGFDFLRDAIRPSASAASPELVYEDASPCFQLQLARFGIAAKGQEVDSEFFVLEGSLARAEWIGTMNGYQKLHQQLCEEGVLVKEGQELCRFTRDYAFSSPSAAAAIVVGRNANGRVDWKLIDGSISYGEWQDRQVSVAAKSSGFNPGTNI